ncbi:MAG TPA: 2TM domain-containing protein [Ktedonobacterales bacterium]
MMEGITLSDYEKAEGELQAREGRISFYVHATIYALVNILLIVINLMFVPTFYWFFFPLIGWGIGLAMHYLFAIHFAQRETADWQARVEHRAREIHTQQASMA